MHLGKKAVTGKRLPFIWLIALTSTLLLSVQTPAFAKDPASTNEIRIVELQGKVEVSTTGANVWQLPRTNQILHHLDRLRTAPKSRVALRWSDQSVVSFGPSTEIEILAPHARGAQNGLHVLRGI